MTDTRFLARLGISSRSALNLLPRALSLPLLAVLSLTSWSLSKAQEPEEKVTFVQLTDAHIFDDGWKEATAGAFRIAADDREALTWAVAETNHLVAQGAHVDFVVFTGDIGLQNVEIPSACKAQPVQFEPGLPPIRFDSAVRELADQLRQLDVKRIYFVPGNNDLIDEQITDLPRYSCFINELQKQLLADPNPMIVATLELGNTFMLNGVNFTGLDSSSFKKAANYQTACGGTPRARGGKGGLPHPKSCPQDQLTKLRRFLTPSARAPLIIFTHVPDLIDPFTKRPAWSDFAPDLRRDWEDEACQPNVIGIFAGHFHDSDRQYYGSPTGAQLLATSACVAAKTWVAPPLAVKNQKDKTPQARGFMLATISLGGVVNAEVHWFAPRDSSQPKCDEKNQRKEWCHWVETLSMLVLVLTIVGLMVWLTLKQKEGKAPNRDATALVAVFLFLTLSFAVLWFIRVRLGITEATIQIAVLILVVLVYGVVSGRLIEFTGPGGWGAKFREVAFSKIDLSFGRVDLTNSEMQDIPKTGLIEIERKLQSLTPGKPVTMSLTLGRGDYDALVLHSALQALMRIPNFRFVVFLYQDGRLLCYTRASSILHLLDADQNGVMTLAGTGRDLVHAVNTGDVSRILKYPGMIRKAITVNASNEQALDAMGSVGTDAILVVTEEGIPAGVAEMGPIMSRMIAALARGSRDRQ